MSQGPKCSILVTIRITVWIQESEIRNPHSLDYRKSYQRILTKFYGELGCGLETNWLHFGDDPDHYPNPGVRSASRSVSGKNYHVVNTHRRDALSAAPMSSILVDDPDHRPDPGVRSPKSGFTGLSIMLAFGRGLSSLSTSSLVLSRNLSSYLIVNGTSRVSMKPNTFSTTRRMQLFCFWRAVALMQTVKLRR